ncbi:MAG: hypothetical protein A2589_01580 [Candidatus Vogelbacteria bacterium RIFOXYD1_FULL_46_19]|uniref:Uncharacterized protein n=1 Tax=Candidatus Vogelbacteria bacterium RIFOXYD1_FULL_46_19 TaxID=1802439 RepID=A0A1G2QFZ1_9BACT|nr:MAG: hypothetical protein A2589_01580 [Candidatus Vogelbacteria bacterium RIFOXYD1_FULL_46_19]
MEQPEVNIESQKTASQETKLGSRLGIEIRNPVQAKVLKKILDPKESATDQMKQIKELGQIISDILDDPAETEVQTLALAGQYQESAELIVKKMTERKVWPLAA